MFKKVKENKVEKLYKLKRTLEEKELFYIDETKEKITVLKEQVEKELEKALKKEEVSEDVFNTWGSYQEQIEKRKHELIEERELLLKKCEEMLEKLLNVGFYPPEYIFELNMIRGIAVDMEEWQEKNQLKEKDYEERIKKLDHDIDKFLKLHKEVADYFEATKDNMENKKLKEKDELARNLQMGRLKEVEIRLKKIKKMQ